MTRHSQEKTGEKNFPKMTQKWLQEGVGSDKPTALSKVTALVDGGLPSFDAPTLQCDRSHADFM